MAAYSYKVAGYSIEVAAWWQMLQIWWHIGLIYIACHCGLWHAIFNLFVNLWRATVVCGTPDFLCFLLAAIK